MAQEPQPSQIDEDRGSIMEMTPSSNVPSARTIEAKQESGMSTPTPLIVDPGSHSTENEHKSMTETFVSSDDLSTPGSSHNRHESNGEPVPPTGQQKPESIIQDTPQRQDQPPTASGTEQGQNTRESCLSRDLEQGILPADKWISRPRMSIIDIDDRGLRTRTWRGWVDELNTERQGPSTVNSGVRITLVERKTVEVMRRGEEQDRSKFRMLDLQALLSTERPGPSFLFQINYILGSGWSSRFMRNEYQEAYLNPLLSEVRHIGFDYWFWELYAKLVFNSSDLRVEGV